MRVLVTGGAGFIGSHIVDALLARGHDVLVMDNYSSGRKENLPADVRVWKGCITQGYEPTHTGILPAVKDFQPDAICHQAAQPSLRRSIESPYYDASVNILGMLRVIEAAQHSNAHVVFASTSAVYDPAGGLFDESSPVMPNLPYGIAKAAAEQYLRASGVSHTILRYGNVYGPRQVAVGENQLIPHVLGHLRDNTPFAINGDGQQTRDFVYVGDIAQANVRALETRTQGTFNIGTGVGTAVWEVCEQLAWLCEWRGQWRHTDARAGEAKHVTLDSDKAARVLGWTAETPLTEGLRLTIGAWGR